MCGNLLWQPWETNTRPKEEAEGLRRPGVRWLQVFLGSLGPGGYDRWGYQLTIDHLRCHPVGVAYHCVTLFAVWLLEASQVLGMRLLIYHEPCQPEVGHHHILVLE